MSRQLMVGAIVLALGGGLLLAEEGAKGKKGAAKGPDAEAIFKKKDTNADGKLSLEEYKAGLKPEQAAKADARFKKLDANADGSISLDEFKSGWTQAKEKAAEKAPEKKQ